MFLWLFSLHNPAGNLQGQIQVSNVDSHVVLPVSAEAGVLEHFPYVRLAAHRTDIGPVGFVFPDGGEKSRVWAQGGRPTDLRAGTGWKRRRGPG